jgi:hypothetical protein
VRVGRSQRRYHAGAMHTPTRTRSALVVAVALVAVVVIAVVGLNLSTPAASPSASPVAVVLTPSPALTAAPSATPLPTDTPFPSASPAPSDPPSVAPSASASPSPAPTKTPVENGPLRATRVVIPALGIDLAITKSPPAGVYPYCNVAMNFGKPFGQPGQAKATYIFAHARDGMFGPIYTLTMVKRTPNKMVGMEVDVYTSDSKKHVYKITRVLPHQLSLNRPLAATHDQLWLQTSEGPHGTPGKTQVMAEPVSVSDATYGASHPKAHIVRCG